MKHFKWRAALFLLFLIAGGVHAEPATLNEVTVTATSDKARIRIAFSKVPGYKVFSLSNPPRIVIDLKETTLTANLKNLNLAPTPLDTIRSGQQQAHGLRLVIDLKRSLPALTTTLEQDGRHLVIELGGTLPAIAVVSSQPIPGQPDQKKAEKIAELAVTMQNEQQQLAVTSDKRLVKSEKGVVKPPLAAKSETAEIQKSTPTNSDPKLVAMESEIADKIERAKIAPPKRSALIGKAALEKPKSVSIKGIRDVIIVIDPGHGGKDSGAKGVNGTYEKNIVLAISKKLQQLIQQEPGMRAVLTRKGDYFISLRERLRIARKDKADLFIAIHADAFTNPNSSGASVFALSATGASSEAARWLAEKENYSELGGIPLTDKSDLLRSVLIDLSQTGIISLSLQLGHYLLKDMGKIARLHHGSVEQARFVVLKSLDIPSVLVETGFISNAQEEQRLSDPIYQAQLAEALFKGIRNYFKQYPPPGTRLAHQKDGVGPSLARVENLNATVD